MTQTANNGNTSGSISSSSVRSSCYSLYRFARGITEEEVHSARYAMGYVNGKACKSALCVCYIESPLGN